MKYNQINNVSSRMSMSGSSNRKSTSSSNGLRSILALLVLESWHGLAVAIRLHRQQLPRPQLFRELL